jgi:hypothetical protein
MRRSSTVLFFCLLFYPLSDAGAAGSATAAFLKIGVGARNVAMGETGAAETGVYATYWNPAGLAALKKPALAFMHAAWLSDIQFQNLAYALPTAAGTFGIAATYLSMDAIERRDNTGLLQQGTYKPSDTAVGLSYARAFGDLYAGATLRYISSSLDDASASGVAADAGVMTDRFSLFGRKLAAALALQNMGSSMKFSRESSPLPFNARLGVRYSATDAITAALDLNKPLDGDLILNTGAEYAYPFGRNAALAGRLGYRSNVEGLGGNAGITAGIGISYAAFTVDYAFVPYGDLNDTHRVSLLFSF